MTIATATATATIAAAEELATIATIEQQAHALVTFETLSVPTYIKGAARTVARVQHHGAAPMVLASAGKSRKALLAHATQAQHNALAAAMAGIGQERSLPDFRGAYATVCAMGDYSPTVLLESGKVPRTEWLRLRAELASKPQADKAGKPTRWAKAVALWDQLQGACDALRATRDASRARAVTA